MSLRRASPSLPAASRRLCARRELVAASIERGGKPLICGNGGSAADAQHIAGELCKGFLSRRRLSPRIKEKLMQASPQLDASMLDRLQWGLPAIPLTGSDSLFTAFANDVDAELVYAQQLIALGRRATCCRYQHLGQRAQCASPRRRPRARHGYWRGRAVGAWRGRLGTPRRRENPVCPQSRLSASRSCICRSTTLFCAALEEHFGGYGVGGQAAVMPAVFSPAARAVYPLTDRAVNPVFAAGKASCKGSAQVA